MPPKKIQAKPPLQAKTKRSLATKAIEEEYKVESDDEQDTEAAVLPESHGDEVDVQQLVKDVRSAVSKARWTVRGMLLMHFSTFPAPPM